MNCRVGVVKGEELLSYSFPRPHPFTKERVLAFWGRLEQEGVPIEVIRPEKADRQTIELFHGKEHVDFVQRASNYGYGYLDGGDTPVFKGIFEAAQYTVGSTLKCLQMLLDGEFGHAFNPVGGLHHATRDSSAGFCVFNDIGVAIEVLRRQYKMKRVLYVDIDVHHGDGVFYSYESDPSIFIFDLHEDGRYLYPGTGFEYETGKGPAADTKINVPLPPGAGDEKVRENLSKLNGLARAAKPEFIILQCGADGLADDPIAGLRYTSEAHRIVTSLLHRLSHELCSGRIVALGGGGYSPENCANAWLTVVKNLTSRADSNNSIA